MLDFSSRSFQWAWLALSVSSALVPFNWIYVPVNCAEMESKSRFPISLFKS